MFYPIDSIDPIDIRTKIPRFWKQLIALRLDGVVPCLTCDLAMASLGELVANL
jgi:hypothetical protein